MLRVWLLRMNNAELTWLACCATEESFENYIRLIDVVNACSTTAMLMLKIIQS